MDFKHNFFKAAFQSAEIYVASQGIARHSLVIKCKLFTSHLHKTRPHSWTQKAHSNANVTYLVFVAHQKSHKFYFNFQKKSCQFRNHEKERSISLWTHNAHPLKNILKSIKCKNKVNQIICLKFLKWEICHQCLKKKSPITKIQTGYLNLLHWVRGRVKVTENVKENIEFNKTTNKSLLWFNFSLS